MPKTELTIMYTAFSTKFFLPEYNTLFTQALSRNAYTIMNETIERNKQATGISSSRNTNM